MALNFVKSYTFTPSTTVVSNQVNTNFDDIASVFQGLEAETKTPGFILFLTFICTPLNQNLFTLLYLHTIKPSFVHTLHTMSHSPAPDLL